MTSTYIHEVRKKQKEYLSYLFDKFEKYSNRNFLNNFLNKSINEIALYPFQDINDTEVLADINDYINELTINAQYKKKSIFKHLCEIFLSNEFHIYDEKDRYELKYVILRLFFLISESSRNENTKEIDLLYNKYFIKQKEEESKILNINEQNALEDINNFNIIEEKKYLNELYNTDDENTRFSSLEDEDEIDKDENKKENRDYLSNVDIEITSYKNEIENNNIDSNFNNFYETKYSYIENYMKNKNEITYENVIKKIYDCICKYPHYENIKDKIKSKNILLSNRDINNNVSVKNHNNYKNENIYENKSGDHMEDSSIMSDEDIFISLKKKQKKSKDMFFKSKSRERYFFNNINIFDEEDYENTENEGNLIYETDIYNLHNVFLVDKKDNKKNKENISNDMNSTKINKIDCHEYYYKEKRINETLEEKNKDDNKLIDSSYYSKIIVEETNNKNMFKGIYTTGKARNKKKNSFFVSEIFIIKEILMILSLNCPIKFRDNFFTNFSNFLFNRIMDKNKIKDDFLFYIEIEKKNKKNNKKENSNNKYYAVIKKMMNVKLYNIGRKSFNNYIKKMKKVCIKIFYINIFFFLANKFRNFFFFLSSNLSDIFNYIIYFRENINDEKKKKNFFFFFDQINMNNESENNMYYQGNFLESFVSSLKNIYFEWICVIDILYNYHILLILKQYNLVPICDEQIFEFLQKIKKIKVIDYLKLSHFANLKKKKKKKGERKIKCEGISSFRSLSLIHLNYIINNYLYMWNNLYDFINLILSYLLYNISINDYIYFNYNFDNAKKFCICYDMVLLYWRNCQIINNKSLEKIFRFLLNDLNIYYSKHIDNWIKKGKIDDKFNEFFIFSSKIEGKHCNSLFIRKQNEFILCPEFFNSFIFFLISLGNNIRLYMKINNEKNIDYIDYYLKEEKNIKYFEDEENLKLYSCENEDNSNFVFFEENEITSKKLHENTLNYYYNLENIKKIQNTSLDIISKFLTESRSKNLPYFNQNIMLLNIPYDLYIKKYFQEHFFNFYEKSNRIFLHSLMKYCYLLEYFCCLRSLVFLEISDYILPFFEFVFKEVSFPFIDERNINSLFKQCVYSSNQYFQKKNSANFNYSCSSFLHKKFTLIHMNILLSRSKNFKHKKRSKRKKNFNIENYSNIIEKKIYHPYDNGNNTNNLKKKKNIKEINDSNSNNTSDSSNVSNIDTKKKKIIYFKDYNPSNTSVNNNNDSVIKKLDNSYEKSEEESNYIIKEFKKKGNDKFNDISDKNLRKHTICVELNTSFYTEEVITNILKSFYFKLKENKIYNNKINVINYRNLIIETKTSPFMNFLIDSACLEKYSAIFSYFLEIKKSLQILNLVHIFYKYLKTKKNSCFENFHTIIFSLYNLKYKIFFFLNTIYTYYQWMLNFSWNNFIFNLSKSKSLDHIKNNHQFYLNFLIEVLLVPILTDHEELYNFYVNEEYKNNTIYKEYERIFFNYTLNKKEEISAPDNVSFKKFNLCNNYDRNIIKDVDNLGKGYNTKEDIYIDNMERNPYKLHQFSINKQFLLNELFSNNILNLLFIPSQIYEILIKLSKFLNINFDLNFDNPYDNDFDEDKKDEEDEDEEEIKKVKNNIINMNSTNDSKHIEKEQFIFSIKNDIKILSKVFEIHFSEFMMKLNIISFNTEDNNFFGPHKDSKLFNHIIRLDKNILKKVSILENMLSFHSYNDLNYLRN
ncbi:conserved Plasmodium protein, unknown function [Plasmodium relictum]|uniref:Gamma tubulin complex component protein N-terminal domain-containing protein n=1 Tax=Plasmodium relictum TaxID=85471 RepID=A0A1J1HA52_PLARL|nr:conserved Plasmodium protein, unknown function [Plasmodium relictum]CRH01392.1 conserved Plasmodium protein, unknown function [Plasmodium relictum]